MTGLGGALGVVPEAEVRSSAALCGLHRWVLQQMSYTSEVCKTTRHVEWNVYR